MEENNFEKRLDDVPSIKPSSKKYMKELEETMRKSDYNSKAKKKITEEEINKYMDDDDDYSSTTTNSTTSAYEKEGFNFFPLAVGTVAIAVVILVSFLIISQVNSITQTATSTVDKYVEEQVEEVDSNKLTDNLQTPIFAVFGLIAVSIIILAAFGSINIFKN